MEPGSSALMQAHYAGRYRDGEYRDALAACGWALAIDPNNADDHCNFGEILGRLERRDEALVAFAKAIALDPRFAEAYHKRGASGQILGDFASSILLYNRALALLPGSVELRLLRLSALVAGDFGTNSQPYYKQILSTPARTAEELLIRGCALAGLERHAEAVRAQSQALALKPDAFDSWFNRAIPIGALAGYGEAIRNARRALAIKPDYGTAHSSVIFWLDFIPNLGFAAHQSERRKWSLIQHRAASEPAAVHSNTRNPDRIIRLGYVSADFKRHSAADIFGTVLSRHDRSRFELILYSGVVREDERTQVFRALATEWRSTLGLAPDALARQIRADSIDILVDLSGHTIGNHLLTFVRKPAPVQVTAWGHGTGTGIKEIDYFFADPILIPNDVRSMFAEKIYDLPCFMTFAVPDGLPEVTPPPAARSGVVTFGCFNRAAKIGSIVVATWSRILSRAPKSRLLLKDRAFDSQEARVLITREFERFGVTPDRLLFRGMTSRWDHLAAHSEIDIALDPFPANGGVSTCEAISMGVPVVAFAGSSAPSRGGASLLAAIGLPEWVGADLDAYVEIAVSWAWRVEALATLRHRLRAQFFASPVGDPVAYTRAAEAAFRDIWRRWCEGGR